MNDDDDDDSNYAGNVHQHQHFKNQDHVHCQLYIWLNQMNVQGEKEEVEKKSETQFI